MKKRRVKSQASIEFLVIFGVVFLMMIPLIIIFFDQTGFVQDAVAESQIRTIAVRIVDKAETVYYTGGSSKTTLRAYLPEGVESFNVTSRAILANYMTKKGILHTIEAVSLVNITGNLSAKPGIHNIEIESAGGVVLIRE